MLDVYLLYTIGISIKPLFLVYTLQGIDPRLVQSMLLEHSLIRVRLKLPLLREVYLASSFARRRFYSTSSKAAGTSNRGGTEKIDKVVKIELPYTKEEGKVNPM